MTDHAQALASKINDRSALVGIIGLGYVGLPLALAFTEKGFTVLGFDVDPVKVDKINSGDCYIKHLDPSRLLRAVGREVAEASGGKGGNSKFKIQNSKFLSATSDFSRLSEADAILICVPTPLGPHKEPDLSYVESSAHSIRETLRPGQLVILESTTYPGTTDDLLKPILESPGEEQRTGPADGKSEIRNPQSEIPEGPGGNSESRVPNPPAAAEADQASSKGGGHEPPAGDGASRRPQADSNSEFMKCGTHFFLAFSPEREDPGNPTFGTTNVPKVVGGVDPISGDLSQALYDQIIDSTIRVSSARIAEASKLTENIFRSVNIALVNELKVIYDRLGIDVWEVLDAAETKPFGFMRFNPGPGLGGHCIIGTEWLRVRGCGLAGVYRAADLFSDIACRFPAAVTRNGIFVEPRGLEALALDVKSGDVTWYPVTTLYRGRYRGDGVCVSTSHGGQLTVTSEHPMLIRRGRSFDPVPANRLSEGDCLPVVTDNDSAGSALTATKVTATDYTAIDGWVYSMEVEDAGTYTTSSGIGVHNCIPLDPFYLAWRAREAGVPTRFIELAGEINTAMPGYVIDKLQAALNEHGKAMKGAKILVLGLAYKPNIDDPRESPAFEIIDLLLKLGADVTYHDPHIPVAPRMRSWPDLPQMKSAPLTADMLQCIDAAIVITNHKAVDYDLVLDHAPLIIDTRGVFRHHNHKVRQA